MRRLPELLTSANLSALKARSARGPADAAPLLGDAGQGVQVRAITPVIGGHVDPFTPGKSDLVRVPSIRGAVRWWWRALLPELTTEALRERERRVWGGVGRDADEASCASAVRVEVVVVHDGKPCPAGEYPWQDKNGKRRLSRQPEWEDSRLGYALFPLQHDNTTRDAWTGSGPMPTKEWRKGLVFELSVSLVRRGSMALDDDDRRTVLEAFKLWLTFGGYGARTRRGFGALHTDAATYEEARRVIASVRGGARKERPTLAQCVLLEGPKKRTAEEALGVLIEALRDFRQGKGYGRDPGADPRSKKLGRSRWPEADSLRKLHGGRFTAHRPHDEHRSPSAPRAAFGLPIQVKFITEEDRCADGSIGRTAEGGRWASPLLLRPVCLGKDSYLPVALVLAGHRPEPACLRLGDTRRGKDVPVLYDDTTHGGARLQVRQALIGSRGSALDAFTQRLIDAYDFRRYKGS